jgi:putative tryptophan/tyrosine transport system substrate-binding protein
VTTRRAFIGALAGGLVAAPLAAEAQSPGRVWRIGHLDGTSPMARAARLSAFKDRLQEMGYAPSQYVLDSRYAEGDDARLAELAADLVRGKPDVIITAGPQPAFAAARATTTIPIVFIGVGDPVGTGLVPSLARPDGNITGVTLITVELAGKRLDLLREAVPAAGRIAVLWNPANPVNARELKEAQAGALSVTLMPVEIRSSDDLENAFAAASRDRAHAVFVLSSPITFLNRPRVAGAALKQRLPALCALREYAVAGCLLSYGPNFPDMFRVAASYVDKILKGARPRDLPVQQPTEFELVINLKTARALGLRIPPSLLLQADQVIE